MGKIYNTTNVKDRYVMSCKPAD